MQITYYSQSSFGIETSGTNLLFDPFISPNPKAEKVDIEQIPADFILLSHGHADHTADAEAIGKRTGATLISNYEIINWFGEKGLKGHPMNHGGKWNFPFGTVKYVSAVHTSSMPDGSYGGEPGGFIIQMEGKTFYYSGDTALHSDMKLFGEFYDIDFAFLCIGDNFTMGYEDAAIAADFLKCNDIIGMHFDTFASSK